MQSAVVTTSVPLSGAGSVKMEMEGKAPVEEAKLPEIAVVSTSPEYLQTIGIPVVRGRGLTCVDGLPGREVAIGNQLFAAKYFPGEGPVGKRVRMHWEGERPWVTVVGVNRNFQQTRNDAGDMEPLMYVPYRMRLAAGFALLVRAAAAPKGLTSGVRQAIQIIDSALPVFRVSTLEEQFEQQRWAFRVFGTLFTIFALIALLLSSVGLYAMMAYSVSRRTREIGVRMAIGASTSDVLRLVMSQGVRQLGIGLAAGLVVGVARAAMKVDPMEALRYE